MLRLVMILNTLAFNTQVLASENVAKGFHLGVGADAGFVKSTDSNNLIASTGELSLGFQAENGFLVNGIFHGGYWGDHSNKQDMTTSTWETNGGAAQVGWKISRLKLLAGYQWAAVQREESLENSYKTIDDGYYYGPNAGISISLIDRPGIGLDIGTRAAFLRWDERADKEPGKNLTMVTSGIHLHLYPANWDNRGSQVNSHLWFNFPYDATMALLEFGPRLTLEILRAAVLMR